MSSRRSLSQVSLNSGRHCPTEPTAQQGGLTERCSWMITHNAQTAPQCFTALDSLKQHVCETLNVQFCVVSETMAESRKTINDKPVAEGC